MSIENLLPNLFGFPDEFSSSPSSSSSWSYQSKGMSLSETLPIKQSSHVATIGSFIRVVCEGPGVGKLDYTLKWSKVGKADLDDNVTGAGGTMRFENDSY